MSTQQNQNRPGEGNKPQNQTNSTTTCIVGCKMPAGFLVEMGDREEGNYTAIKLNGSATLRVQVINGFGITKGVPVALFDAWFKKMEKRAFVKNGLIFKVDGKDMDSAEAVAKELKGQKSGLEKLDPKKLPANMKDVQKEVTQRTDD